MRSFFSCISKCLPKYVGFWDSKYGLNDKAAVFSISDDVQFRYQFYTT